MRRRRVPGLLLSLVVTLAATPAARGAGGAPVGTFSGRVAVREVGVLVGPPSGRGPKTVEKGLVIVEDGVSRGVARLEKPGEGYQWSFLVYLDGPLSRRDTAVTSLLTLAHQAETLTGMGPVAVMVADPRPREVVAPTRAPRRLEEELARLAGHPPATDALDEVRAAAQRRMRGEPEARHEAVEAAVAAERQLVRRQTDRLVLTASEACPDRPCALLWIGDGFDLHPEARYADLLPAGKAPPEEPELGTLEEETARTLAAYGWVVISLPLRRHLERRSRSRTIDDFELYRESVYGELLGGVRVYPWLRQSGEEMLPATGYDVFLEPRFQPLRGWSDATAGAVLRMPEQLPTVLAGLAWRRQVWFRSDTPRDGRPRALEVYREEDGRPVEAPKVVGYGTPPPVAAARLRALRAGEGGPGDLDVCAWRLKRGGGSGALAVTPRELPDDDGSDESWSRLTVLAAGGAVPRVRHWLLPPRPPGETGRPTWIVPDPGEEGTEVVGFEDLGPERWGGRVLPEGAGAPWDCRDLAPFPGTARASSPRVP